MLSTIKEKKQLTKLRNWRIMLYEELLDYLQNLTQRKITQQDMGEALDVTKQAIGKKKAEKYDFKTFEIERIKNYVVSKYNVQMLPKIDRSYHANDIIKIPYVEWLPEEMKNPKYPYVAAQSHSIEGWGTDLRIIAMNGDNMEYYWYKIRNKDVLIIDLAETKINANGSGVYFATSRNNTLFWTREMQKLYNGDIEFRSYSPSGHNVRVLTKEQLSEADFRVIGKVIKNVSFTL